MPAPPAKLKLDAIVEALLEIQFEHAETAERVVGKLANSWPDYETTRLPLADMPLGFREGDANLRYQPTLQLTRPTPGEVAKIGPKVLSLHVLRPYPGWSAFQPRLEAAIQALFEAVSEPHIHRVGLRYVNALTPAHGFENLWNLNFDFSVDGERPMRELVIGYN